MASLQAAWQGAAVTVFERNPSVGRKLLVTGSGRCNITNEAAGNKGVYACADPEWMEALLGSFGVADLLAVLSDIGILVYQTHDGWYYPLSESAHSVVAAFASALEQSGVVLCSPAQVHAITARKDGFQVAYTRGDREEGQTFDRVIVSAGGMAYPSLGSRGELFAVLERLGHNVFPKRPALAPILADLGPLQPLQGVRLDAGVTLWDGKNKLGVTRGNLIFTQWGLNGPAVMDLSHYVSARPDAALTIALDLLAFTHAAFDQLLARKRDSSMPARVLLGSFFPPKVVDTYLKNARIDGETPLHTLRDGALDRLVRALRDTRLPVKGVRGFEHCQVSAGGVPVGEVDPRTLESRIMKGLYLTGETLDVVGPCGGYNLQYAFSSGALAGRAAAG